MKKIFLLFSITLGLCVTAVQAQKLTAVQAQNPPTERMNRITGRVVRNSDNAPVGYATVTLLGADSVAVAGGISDAAGGLRSMHPKPKATFSPCNTLSMSRLPK